MRRTRANVVTSMLTLLSALLGASSFAVLTASPAAAHGSFDQGLTDDCNATQFAAEGTTGGTGPAPTFQQEFVPSTSRLTGLDLCVDASNPNVRIDVSIQQGSLSSPGATVVSGLTTPGFTGTRRAHIDFTATTMLSAGTKYVITVPGKVGFALRGTCAASPSGGCLTGDLYAAGASSGSASVVDFWFQTFSGVASKFFTSETSFVSMLPSGASSENFDGFASGVPISEQIPGLYISSPNVDQPKTISTTGAASPANILFGGFPNCSAQSSCSGQTTQPQVITVDFNTATNAIGFYVASFDPTASPYAIEISTTDGNMRFSFADNDANENTPQYFGISTTARITELRLISGFEVNGVGGFEEFGLDNLTWTQINGLKNLQLTVEERSTRAGVSAIPFASVPAARIPAAFDDAVNQAPASRIPASRIPASRIPASRIDVATSPASRIPASRIGLDAAHLGPQAMAQLDRVLISTLPASPSFNLTQIVAASTVLSGLPFQSITLKQLLEDPQARAALTAKTFGDIRGFVSTVLRGLPALAFYLGDLPWASLPDGSGGRFDTCASLNGLLGVADACGQFGITPSSTTPLGAAIAQAPASRIPASRIDVGSIPGFGSTALGAVGLRNFAFRLTPMSGRPVSQAAGGASSIADCSRISCGSATLGQAEAAQAFLANATLGDLGSTLLSGVTLQDLMIGIAGLDNVPWGSLDLNDAQTYAGNGAKLRYHANFDIDCTSVSSVHVSLTLRGMVFEPGSATMQIDTAPAVPVNDPAPPVGNLLAAQTSESPTHAAALSNAPVTNVDWTPGTQSSLPNPCAGLSAATHHVHLAYRTLPGATLGEMPTDIWVDANGENASLNGAAPVQIVEANEPNDDPASAPLLQPRSILLGQIRDHADVDYLRIPTAPRGSTVRMILTPAPGKDYDLVVSIPPVQSPQSAPASRIPASRITVGHETNGIDNADHQLPPETLEDTPASRIPASRISAHHDADDEVIEFISRGETGFYTIAIGGYNGAHDSQPYRFWTTQSSTLPSPPCVAPVLPYQETNGAQDVGKLPKSVPATTETFFIVNRDMTSDLDGAAATSALFTKLATVAARPDVKGAILEVDGDTAVRNAVNGWIQTPGYCSVDVANTIVRETVNVINRYRTPSLKNIVIIGSDLHMPSWRQTDPVLAEADSASDLIFTTSNLTKNNAQFSAVVQNYMLVDEAYGVVDQYLSGNREILHGGLSVSRLGENATQIAAQLQRYIDDDGYIDLAATVSGPSRALVTGYDFLVDGAQQQQSLQQLMGSANVRNLGLDAAPGNAWNRNDIISRWFGSSNKLVAPNAHFNHYLFEPKDAATDPFSLDDVVSTRDLMDAAGAPVAGQLIFTVGCHAGRTVPNYLVPMPSYDEQLGDSAATIQLKRQLRDWAETIQARGSAIYIANSTYGYGDDAAPALSERLMAIFSDLLKEGTPGATVGAGTIGEKLAKAKDLYFRTKGTTYGDIDETVLLGAHLYGMPTYRLKNGTFTAPATQTPPVTTNVTAGLDISSYHVNTNAPAAGVDFRPLTRVDNSDGTTFWHQNGATEAQEFRPLQPVIAPQITVPGKVAAGALLKGLATHDVLNIKPHEVFPVLDQSSHTANAPFTDAIWPAGGLTTRTSKLFGQLQQNLVMDLGYYIPNESQNGRGTQRLVDDATVEISYGDPTGAQPFITQVSAAENGDQKTFFVRAADGSGAPLQFVGVFFHTATDGTWKFQTLAPVPGVPDEYSAGPITAPGELEIGAQVRSASGRTAFSTRKGFLFNAIPATEDAAPEVTIDSPVEGQSMSPGQRVTARFSCSDDVGVTACTAVDDAGHAVTNGGLLDTSVRGERYIDISATDSAGTVTTVRRRYFVENYTFIGFLKPVSNFPAVNDNNAGSTVPVKWRLKDENGAYVSDLTAVQNIVSAPASCSPERPANPATESAPLVPVSNLTYDTSENQFTYKFVTDKAWAGSCRRLTIYFRGSLVRFADFRFK